MEKKIVESFVGRPVRVSTNEGMFFSGFIEDVDDKVLRMTDKYGQRIVIELRTVLILRDSFTQNSKVAGDSQ